MIDEAIGKILGMAMAYVASAAGMFVAYVNYRRRVVKADKIMTPAAWAVIAISALAVAGAVVLVGQLATAPAAPVAEEAPAETAAEEPGERAAPATQPRYEPDRRRARDRWPWVGIVIPAAIFLFATVVTAALHRHFTAHGH